MFTLSIRCTHANTMPASYLKRHSSPNVILIISPIISLQLGEIVGWYLWKTKKGPISLLKIQLYTLSYQMYIEKLIGLNGSLHFGMQLQMT